MDMIRTWLTSVVMVTMLLSLVQMLIPEGSVRKVASFTRGLVLLLALLQPLLGIDVSDLKLDWQDYRLEIERRQQELEQSEEETWGERIAERTEAYISDKGQRLGVEVTAKVETELSPEGIPLPAEVEMTGSYTPELAEYMEQELGIPAERQVWHENES